LPSEDETDVADGQAEQSDNVPAEGKSAQDRLLNAWLAGKDFTAVAVPAGLDRELLRKHVPRYVKGQTADFFVHPRLGAFLRGELDYFLKNEFVSVWDLPDDALPRERGKHRIVKHLAERIIAVLATIEDVQAILFEKRKFVIGCDWLIRASALAVRPGGQALLDQVCANAAQVAEWARWVGEGSTDGRSLLQRHPHLPVHTAHVTAALKTAALACFPDLDAATSGVLMHAENYAALRTIEPAYRQSVKCIYIDPPYNTDAGPILYKNDLREASWISMTQGRVKQSRALLSEDGVLCATIDDYEVTALRSVVETEFGKENLAGIVAIRINPSGRPKPSGFATSHEYAIFALNSEIAEIGRLPRTQEQRKRYKESDADGAYMWELFRKRGSNSERAARRKLWYPLYVKGQEVRVPRLVWHEPANSWQPTEVPGEGETVEFPRDDQGVERRWRWKWQEVVEHPGLLKAERSSTGAVTIYYRYRPGSEGVLPTTTWTDAKYSATEHGTGAIKNLFADGDAFSYPKSPFAVMDCLRACAVDAESGHVALDFFAGSGTTGHAVINLNRVDGGERRFTLIEQGDYFDTVLLPRIAKVITCPDWKDGKPKAEVSMLPAAGEDPASHWSARTPELVKILRLERYEDALDTLELPADAEARAAGQETLGLDREVIRYLVQSVAGGATVRLATEKLATPFDYRLPYTQAGQHTTVAVDLVETAHLLLGLHPIRVRRLTDAPTGVAVIEEVRPHGAAADVRELVFWRTVDESLAGAALKQRMEAERDWLVLAVQAQFGRTLSDYRRVRHNRDLLLPAGVTGESIDASLAQAMMERA
jgi:adenine-specific DNA-methyltransferase